MSYKLVLKERFIKKSIKLLKKNPNLKEQFNKTIKLLENDPFYPSLRLHKLKGTLKEYYSVSINMSYRIVIDLIIIEDKIILLDIGNHDEIY